MEQLNEYLQRLISTSSDELRLEPNRCPFVTSAAGTSDVSDVPLVGTQISMMVFPLIPPAVKQDLPNQPQIQFVHPHVLGKFTFVVQKSPSGFIVTVRPGVFEAEEPEPVAEIEPEVEETPPAVEPAPSPAPIEFAFETAGQTSVASPPAATSDLDQQPVTSAESPFSFVAETPALVTENISFTNGHGPAEPVGESQPSGFIPPLEEYRPEPEPSFEMPVEGITATPVERRVGDRRRSNLLLKDQIDTLLRQVGKNVASLHLAPGRKPSTHIGAELREIEWEQGLLSSELIREMAFSMMSQSKQEEFERNGSTRFTYELDQVRFRCNLAADHQGFMAVLQPVASELMTVEQLQLPPLITDACARKNGFVLLAGKSELLGPVFNALVHRVNQIRSTFIVTVEDPIDHFHFNRLATVSQREIGNHVRSYSEGVAQAMREGAEVVFVRDLNSPEAAARAVEASRSSMVFAGLDADGVSGAVDRITELLAAQHYSHQRGILSAELIAVLACKANDDGSGSSFEVTPATAELTERISRG